MPGTWHDRQSRARTSGACRRAGPPGPQRHHSDGSAGDRGNNPSSSHRYSAQPRRALAEARAQFAALIGARADETVFTASCSEADLLALRGAVLASGRARPHVITQVTEHPAVMETCRALERLRGARVSGLPVDGDGLVNPAASSAALTEETVLQSVLARATGIWHNDHTGQPAMTSLTAYDH